MKRKITVVLTAFAIILSVFSIWYLIPKQYSETINGVYYQLGTEGITERIKVHLDGKLQNHINGKRSFKGEIDFEGSKVPHIPKDRTKLELHYDGHNFTTIFSAFRIIDDKGRIEPNIFTYGWVYTDDKFSEFTIKVMNDDGQWSSSNGYMITAPAKDSQEAMKRSQGLIKEFEEESRK
ncbi:hypothetical protein AB4Z45_02880 [Paenibacillus sp. MCAF9]|uniref:hypothetical protein n=1 Tax=unclassified Paenibacillus TaxID=185978 RepID=UPI003F9A944B